MFINIPILQIRKWRGRSIKGLTAGHTAGKRQTQNSNSGQVFNPLVVVSVCEGGADGGEQRYIEHLRYGVVITSNTLSLLVLMMAL